MVKESVKVVIRTRPTPNFATKNIQIDPINSVSGKYYLFGLLISFYKTLACDCAYCQRSKRRTHQQCPGTVEIQV